MVKNDISRNRTKPIDTKYHLVRQLLVEEEFRIQYCPTPKMLVSFLTKLLQRQFIKTFRAAIGL